MEIETRSKGEEISNKETGRAEPIGREETWNGFGNGSRRGSLGETFFPLGDKGTEDKVLCTMNVSTFERDKVASRSILQRKPDVGKKIVAKGPVQEYKNLSLGSISHHRKGYSN